MSSSNPQRAQIGQLLMAKNAITQVELNSALNHQNRWGGKLGEILKQLGFIKESVLVQVLSEIFQIPFVNLGQLDIELDALELVTGGFARDHLLLPIKLERVPRRTLHVAVARPEYGSAVDELKFLTGISNVKAYLAGETELHAAINKCYSGNLGPGRTIRTGAIEVDIGSPASQEMVIERFNKEELIRAVDTKEQGVAGRLSDMGIVDMLQILGAGGKTLAIHLTCPLGTGRIYLNTGHIIHADTDYVQGAQALYEMVTWHEGTFTIQPNPPEVEQTIYEHNDALILEGLRIMDERQAQNEQASDSRIQFYEPPTTSTVGTPPAGVPARATSQGAATPASSTAAGAPGELLAVDKQVRLLLRILIRKGLLTETEARAILYGKV